MSPPARPGRAARMPTLAASPSANAGDLSSPTRRRSPPCWDTRSPTGEPEAPGFTARGGQQGSLLQPQPPCSDRGSWVAACPNGRAGEGAGGAAPNRGRRTRGARGSSGRRHEVDICQMSRTTSYKVGHPLRLTAQLGEIKQTVLHVDFSPCINIIEHLGKYRGLMSDSSRTVMGGWRPPMIAVLADV